MKKCCFGAMFILLLLPGLLAQRNYSATSILASGNWYKIAVSGPGLYKIDVSFLNKLGINTNNIPSSQIRLFGNAGGMLPEACNGLKIDDLVENSLQVTDGGDGIFNGNDYLLFYADGPDTWIKDSINQSFSHKRNLYNTQSFYFLSIGGTGKRVLTNTGNPVPNIPVTSFSERYFHELDSINFLNSGKDWYGEAFSGLSGHSNSQQFNIPITDIETSGPATLVSNCIARSITAPGLFSVSVNGQPVLQHSIAATSNSNLDVFAKSDQNKAAFTAGSSLVVNYSFSAAGTDGEGWLDWFEIYCRRKLIFNNSQLLFRDWNSVGTGNIASFVLQNGANATVWDITDIHQPIQIKAIVQGSDGQFINEASTLHEYIAFSNNFLTPTAIGKIENQNLHQSSPANLIIIAYPPLLPAAHRLAAYHQQRDKISSVVVSTDQAYNEFASGAPDPTALRDFVKMYYDKAAGDSTKRPKYLLLFGDASFDYKNRVKNNSNFVPAYENSLSLDPLSSYTSDDFFGFLDDNEDINSGAIINQLDIGIGRVPAQTLAQANAYVDKVINYTSPASFGPWRNTQTFVADDEDFNLHFNDAEAITQAAAVTNPLFEQDKIYLDAYAQVSTPAGNRYPDVNQAINHQIEKGTLIWNYNGHGSYTRLAEEVVLEQPMVDNWVNPDKLPLFITATCDFAPYDNPGIYSLGENILLREKTGGIALMTTTRLVFAYSNRIMNNNYLQFALRKQPDGTYPSLGTAVMLAKNFTYQTQTDITNNRKFTLLGDPALTVAYPRYNVQTDSINGASINTLPDTLKALRQYTMAGTVRDSKGILLNNFNGTVHITVFDKPQKLATRANDPTSSVASFFVQRNAIFNGKATVTNGSFKYSFIVPADIDYRIGSGRVGYYADNGVEDANGSFTGFLLGGSQGISADTQGPEIKAYLNNLQFINGDQVDANPLLLVYLKDSSGINMLGTGIGHNITAILDGDSSHPFVLNDYFEAATNTYQNGSLSFSLPVASPGQHSLIIKAWDVANNSSQLSLSFRINKQADWVLGNVFNYPNPVRTKTTFSFEHFKPNQQLTITIQIFTIYGRLLKTINQTINTTGIRSNDIEWNLADEYGGNLAPGVYIYQLQVISADNKRAVKTSKLLVL